MIIEEKVLYIKKRERVEKSYEAINRKQSSHIIHVIETIVCGVLGGGAPPFSNTQDIRKS